MMGTRSRFTNEEFDAFTGWRRLLNWRPGHLKRIKRQFWRRTRRQARRELRASVEDRDLTGDRPLCPALDDPFWADYLPSRNWRETTAHKDAFTVARAMGGAVRERRT
ncbi:hypothetical protein [Camelimonas lactis]|uniref:Uncharacterized protein n=1 Tax=Camelimonas lactis TaxID=659006 RepID=A0A4R2GW50_9HYPH|nr:hypothetical protein [Camelimonas lactis]TCO15228.1 hypothetical protein EV666_102206 [Camelimonas lactis]